MGERLEGTAASELKSSAQPPGQWAQRIVVRDGTRVHIIPVNRIDYVEAQDDYVSIQSEGKGFLKQQTIGSLETSLDPSRFVRVHRSFLISLERLSNIEPYT